MAQVEEEIELSIVMNGNEQEGKRLGKVDETFMSKKKSAVCIYNGKHAVFGPVPLTFWIIVRSRVMVITRYHPACFKVDKPKKELPAFPFDQNEKMLIFIV
jgi:hypothetical protein